MGTKPTSDSRQPLRRWEGHDLVVFPVAILGALDAEGRPLSGTALRLWVALATYANKDHRCWPSNRSLGGLMPAGINKRTIQRAKQELVAAGLLVVTPRITPSGRQTSDLYELHAPQGEGGETATLPAEEGGETVTPEGGQTAAPEGGQTAAPLNLVIQEPHPEEQQVIRVFDAWCASTGRNPNRTRLDEKRRRLIEKALGSYPVDDGLLAVDGWRFSSFHRGGNDRGKTYNDLGLLLRDAQHLEQFRDYALAGDEPEQAASWAALAEVLGE